MAQVFDWSEPFRLTATPDDDTNDVFGYVEGGVLVLDSGIVIVSTISSESYALHFWAIDISSGTPVVGPDAVFNTDSQSFYGYADDPQLAAINDLNHPVALGNYKFGITGEADGSYNTATGTPGGSNDYGHVASIYSVDPDTLVITRDFFVCGVWDDGEAVSGEATTARWDDKMVIISDQNSGGIPYKMWVVDSGTGALTIHDIALSGASTQYTSAVAVAGDTAYYWQRDSDVGPYVMKSLALSGSAATLTSPGDPNDNNYTWYGQGLANGAVVWTFAGDFATPDYPLNIGFAGPSAGNIEVTGLRDVGTGWTGGWYAPTRSISQQSDDGAVLVTFVEDGVWKYRTYTATTSGLTFAHTDVIANFSDSVNYYDYFVADVASRPGGGAVAMWISRHYNGGDENFGIYLSYAGFGVDDSEVIRNLVINPSGEQSFDRAWTANNGNVETNVLWRVGDTVEIPGGETPPPPPPPDDTLPADLTGYTQLTVPGADPALTLQNALNADGKVALISGDWLCARSILFDSDMELYVGSGANLWRNFNSSGATSSGFLRNRNLNTRITGNIIWGPGNIAAKSGKGGNLLSFAADGFRSADWQTTYWTGGRHTMIGGDDIHFSGHVWRADTGSGSGAGGLRFAGGDNFLGENLDVISGDDVYQFVPAGATNDPLFNIADTTNGLYKDCVGRSYSARLCVVGLQDSNGNGTTTLGMNTSISDCEFQNISGFGGGTAVNVANHSSTGTIDHLTFVNVVADQSMTLSPTQGQPGEVYVQREGSSCGNVDHIDFGGVTILHKRSGKALLYTSAPFGGVTNITPPVLG